MTGASAPPRPPLRSGGLSAHVVVSVGAFSLDAEIAVDPGQVVAIVGPNGAGKTTLLEALGGLRALSAGWVTVAGRTVEDPASGLRLAPEERRVGMVFQDRLLFPHLSVADNVAFGLRARGVSRSAARQTAAAWMERVGLAGLADRHPGQLSGGQAQRVALIRALATSPDLLLLDEPLSELDAAARVRVRRALHSHLAGFAGPCLLVTHQPLDAMTLADRIVVVEDGQVTQTGSVSEVTRRPRSAWVAQLVGLNLLAGEARNGRVTLEDGARLVAADTTITGRVLATVHPRAVALHRHQPEGSPRNVWRGAAGDVELAGDRLRVQVRGPVSLVAEITPAAVDVLDLAGGGPVWMSVKASEVDLYPV